VTWTTAELGEVADVKIGPFGSLLHKSDYVEGGIPLVNPMHIIDGRIVPDPEHAVTADKASQLANYRLVEGDVVLGRRGEMGRCAIVRPEDDGYLCGTGSLIVRPSPSLSPQFVDRLLSSPGMIRTFERASLGTTMPNLNQEIVASVQIPLPPLDEQRRIAAILDHADDLRAKRRLIVTHLDDLVSSIFDDMFGNDDWPRLPLSDVVREGTIVTYGIVQAGDEFEGGIPYIRTGDIVGGTIAVDELRRTSPDIAAKFDRSMVRAGDIVMSIRATVGTTAIVPSELDGANLTQGTARIAPGGKTTRQYLLGFLRSDHAQRWIQAQVKGATFREITLGRLRQLPVPIPPLAIQQRYSERITQVQSLIATSKTLAAQNDELFASLQSRAFRGEL